MTKLTSWVWSEFESLKAYPVVNGGSGLKLGVSIFPMKWETS